MIAIAGRHGGPRHAELTALWWREAPHCFHVARSAARRVEGFYIAATEMDVTETLVREDKALGETYRHVWECPPGADESWMLLRMRYCAEHGVDMSPANAVLCLDVKRGYVKHRQRLLRLYSSLDAASDFWPTLRKVGMVRLAGFDHHIDARRHFLTLLNFGPRLLNGWLASLLEIDMAPAPQDAIAIDESSRHLLLERERVPLSPLELRLMRYFLRHKGQALDRDTLLRDVWGRHYESSSNVVDVVVRALRKKLGRHGACIETVTRFGYRFQLPAG